MKNKFPCNWSTNYIFWINSNAITFNTFSLKQFQTTMEITPSFNQNFCPKFHSLFKISTSITEKYTLRALKFLYFWNTFPNQIDM